MFDCWGELSLYCRFGSGRTSNPEQQVFIAPMDLFPHVNEAVLFALALWALCLPQMHTTILTWHEFTSLGSDNLNSSIAHQLVAFLYSKYYYKANYLGNEVVIESKSSRSPKTQRKTQSCHAWSIPQVPLIILAASTLSAHSYFHSYISIHPNCTQPAAVVY